MFDVGCVGARSVEWRPQMHPASVCCGNIMAGSSGEAVQNLHLY